MQIGTALFLIAAGAVLHYAVEDRVSGVDLSAVGVILMIVGAVGLVLSMFMVGRARSVLARERVIDRDAPPRY